MNHFSQTLTHRWQTIFNCLILQGEKVSIKSVTLKTVFCDWIVFSDSNPQFFIDFFLNSSIVKVFQILKEFFYQEFSSMFDNTVLFTSKFYSHLNLGKVPIEIFINQIKDFTAKSEWVHLHWIWLNLGEFFITQIQCKKFLFVGDWWTRLYFLAIRW